MHTKKNSIEYIIHRVNKIAVLKTIDENYGTEIDIRSYNSNLVLNHEPYTNGDILQDYLENYKHNTLILNIKESGIEDDVLSIVKKFKIKSYFLLDIEFPYIFKLINKKNNKFAIRYSEYENIATLIDFKNLAEWAWIDTPSKFPINNNNKFILNNFKTCLVCPERWGRKEDIYQYKKFFKKLDYYPNAIMTSLDTLKIWFD